MSTPGAAELLSEEDLRYLTGKAYQFEVTQAESGLVCVVIRSFPLPAAYTPTLTDLLLRLPPNFPLARPDMFWTHPHVRLTSGTWPKSADQFDVQFAGRQWQRWSRHFDATLWRPGTDDLDTFLGTIRRELQKGI